MKIARDEQSTPPVTMLERAFVDAQDDQSGPGDADALSAAVLDAASELFQRVGFQRTTMDDVARAAGVSRITVYRRFSTKEALAEQVVRREFRQYFGQFLGQIAGADSLADRVVLGFVSAISSFRQNSLIMAMLTAEPSTLTSSMIGDRAQSLAIVREFVSGQLSREQAAGNMVADADVSLTAEIIVRICASFLLTPSDLVDLDDPEALAALAREFLVPLVKAT